MILNPHLDVVETTISTGGEHDPAKHS